MSQRVSLGTHHTKGWHPLLVHQELVPPCTTLFSVEIRPGLSSWILLSRGLRRSSCRRSWTDGFVWISKALQGVYLDSLPGRGTKIAPGNRIIMFTFFSSFSFLLLLLVLLLLLFLPPPPCSSPFTSSFSSFSSFFLTNPNLSRPSYIPGPVLGTSVGLLDLLLKTATNSNCHYQPHFTG